MELALDKNDFLTVTLPDNTVAVLGVVNGALTIMPRLHIKNGKAETVTSIDLMPTILTISRDERLYLHLVSHALNLEDNEILRVNWRNIYFVELMGSFSTSMGSVHKDHLLDLLQSHFGITFNDRGHARDQLTLGGLFFLVKTLMCEKE